MFVPIGFADAFGQVRTRLLASCRRRGGKGWREKDRRLREIFSMIDSKREGHINQEDVTRYARKLRLPPAFVADFVQVRIHPKTR